MTNRKKLRLTCFCGKTYEALEYNVKSGHTRSCGCLRKIILSLIRRKRRPGPPRVAEYVVWKGMRQRCLQKTSKDYRWYGGRGITICERWMKFENFFADMGRRPPGDFTIERINNDGNYEPGNCKWATWKEQAKNRRKDQRAKP